MTFIKPNTKTIYSLLQQKQQNTIIQYNFSCQGERKNKVNLKLCNLILNVIKAVSSSSYCIIYSYCEIKSSSCSSPQFDFRNNIRKTERLVAL